MEKNIKLYDYRGEATEFVIYDFELVHAIDITVLSGDEVAAVTYNDGHIVTFDGATSMRLENYYDGRYTIYFNGMIDIVEDDKFINRKDSYDFFRTLSRIEDGDEE